MCFSVLGAGDPEDDTIGKITTLMAHEFCQGRQIEKMQAKKKKKNTQYGRCWWELQRKRDQGVLMKNDQEGVSDTVTLYTDMMEVTEQSWGYLRDHQLASAKALRQK